MMQKLFIVWLTGWNSVGIRQTDWLWAWNLLQYWITEIFLICTKFSLFAVNRPQFGWLCCDAVQLVRFKPNSILKRLAPSGQGLQPLVTVVELTPWMYTHLRRASLYDRPTCAHTCTLSLFSWTPCSDHSSSAIFALTNAIVGRRSWSRVAVATFCHLNKDDVCDCIRRHVVAVVRARLDLNTSWCQTL